MMHTVTEHPWAADELQEQSEIGLAAVGLESLATPGAHSENAPAPYYAELVTERDGQRLIFRTFFHDLSQLGLHPRTQARLQGLVKRGGHLYIDPEGVQPLCGEIKGRISEYPRQHEDEPLHACIVLDESYSPSPREGGDPFARQKKIRAYLV